MGTFTTREDRMTLAALGVNSILGARFATSLFHQSHAHARRPIPRRMDDAAHQPPIENSQ
jgi:hypothetical protein